MNRPLDPNPYEPPATEENGRSRHNQSRRRLRLPLLEFGFACFVVATVVNLITFVPEMRWYAQMVGSLAMTGAITSVGLRILLWIFLRV